MSNSFDLSAKSQYGKKKKKMKKEVSRWADTILLFVKLHNSILELICLMEAESKI